MESKRGMYFIARCINFASREKQNWRNERQMRIKTAEPGLVLIRIENVERIIILSYLHRRSKRNYIFEFHCNLRPVQIVNSIKSPTLQQIHIHQREKNISLEQKL